MENYNPFWNNALDAFEDQPGFATPMALNLAQLRDMLKTKRGVRDAIEILNEGIDLIYPYTDFNLASVKLYHRFLSKGGLLPNQDPISIVENLEEAERKAKPTRKRIVRATKKKKHVLRVVNKAA